MTIAGNGKGAALSAGEGKSADEQGKLAHLMATRSQFSVFWASCTNPEAPLQLGHGAHSQGLLFHGILDPAVSYIPCGELWRQRCCSEPAMERVVPVSDTESAYWGRRGAHLLRSAILTYLLLINSGCCSARASSILATLDLSTAAAAAAAAILSVC